MDIIKTVFGKGCTHNTYNNGIHEFVFTAATPEAVDTWIGYYLELYKKLDAGKKLLLLLDTTQVGALPLGYIMNRVKVLLAQRPPDLMTLTALVLPPNPINNIALALANYVIRVQQYRDEIKFFSPKEREAGIAWLLQG